MKRTMCFAAVALIAAGCSAHADRVTPTEGLVGAAGYTGSAGPVGSRGAGGWQSAGGEMAMSGSSVPGATGASGTAGTAGTQGPIALTGAQGPAGGVGHWTPYRNFTFEFGSDEIRNADKAQVAEIAAHMAQNPSLRLGLDGAVADPRATGPSNNHLADRRVAAVRDALIRAGTPADKIATGAFGDPRLQREREVKVLLITNR